MAGPELCPKCQGLHYRTSPCIVRAAKSTEGRGGNHASHDGSKPNPYDCAVVPSVDTNSPHAKSRVLPPALQVMSSTTSAGTVGNEDRQPVLEKRRDFAAPLGLASPANASDAKTANTKDAHNAGSSNGRTAAFDAVNAGSTLAPASIPKRSRGRPKTITDMKAYKAAKARQYRAKAKTL